MRNSESDSYIQMYSFDIWGRMEDIFFGILWFYGDIFLYKY